MIVADASPLIVLVKLKQMEILHNLHGEVIVGPVVQAETVEAGNAIRALVVE